MTVTGEATGGEMQYALGTASEATEAYSTAIPTATEAGTYHVWYKVKGDENHSDTDPAHVAVNIAEEKKPDEKTDIGDCKITVKSKTYTGKALKPKVIVRDGKKTLKAGRDYTLSYSKEIVNAGTYKVKVKGKGNYTGSKKVNFKVNPAKIGKCKITVKNLTWSGKALKPKVTVKFGGTKLARGTDYTISTSRKVEKIGTYKVKVKGKGNFTGSKTVRFDVNPKGTTLGALKSRRKKIDVNWKHQDNISGYEIRYATKKDFSDAKIVKIIRTRFIKTTIRKLKRNTKYYVQIRTYKVVRGKTYVSAWSKTKSVKTKKRK